jgi:DNA-binding MarR family transcriptional regulator
MEAERAILIVYGVLALGRRLRAERPTGSKLPAISILSALYRLGSMTAGQLANEERLQPQSLTRIIGELEAKGWIVRTRSEIDRREISIALTGRGKRALANDVRARRIWLEGAMAAALTQTERDTLLKASRAMLKLASFAQKSTRR